MKIPITMLGLIFLCTMSGNPAQRPEGPGAAASMATKESHNGAIQSLKAFPSVVTRNNYKSLGFQSLDEVKSAGLADPLPIFVVGLNDLRNYDTRKDPATLLKGPDSVIYPVRVGRQVRSSITLQRVGDTWKLAAFGKPILGRLLDKNRAEDAARSKSPVSSYFAVWIPALNLYFAGQHAEGTLRLIPLLDDPSLGLKAGTPIPAKRLFERLVPVAKAHSELPG